MTDLDNVQHDLTELMNSDNGCEYTDLRDGSIECIKINNTGRINILHLNVRSFHKNADNLVMLLDDLQDRGIVVHVIALCETFLRQESKDLAKLENYVAIHKTRCEKMGGGVSLFVHDRVKLIREINTGPFNDSFESVSAVLTLYGHPFLVSEIYRPPNSSDSDFMSGLKGIVANGLKYSTSFICGDFNYDLIKSSSHVQTRDFLSYMIDNAYVPYILKPTRTTYSSSTLIDNIFVKNRNVRSSLSYILVEGMSDHFPCFVSYQLVQDRIKKDKDKIRIEKRKLNEENMSKIQQDLLFYDWTPLYGLPVEESYKFLLDVITTALDRHTPRKIVTVLADDKFVEPWLNVRLKRFNAKSRRLCSKFRQSGKREDEILYKNYRNVLNRIKLHEKHQFYNNLFVKIGKSTHLLWKVLNGIIKKANNKMSITEILYKDKSHKNASDISEAFNDHFSTVGLRVQSTIQVDGAENATKPNVVPQKSMKFKPVSEGLVCKVIAKLKPKQSSGVDNISNVLLKKLASVIKLPLCNIINKSLQSGVFPDLMKLALVTPLHKGGESRLPDNYRPISLLPVFSKILEKIVYLQTVEFLNDNNILYSKQYGFRRKHSTIDAIMDLVSEALCAFESNLMMLGTFIDLRKAFDTVSHSNLLAKLSKIGINNTELLWFEGYLSRRKQSVKIDTCISKERLLEVGVPQGSLLGVLLFQLYVNDMFNCLKFTSCILYADDTTIYVIGKSLKFLQLKMNADLMNLSQWLVANRLKLNVSKTKCMVLNKEGLFPEANIYFGGQKLDTVTTFKFLSINLDNDLSFKSHYDGLHSRLLRGCYIVRKLGATLPLECCRTLYFAYFHSHMCYGLHVWWPLLSKANQASIYVLQKRLIRTMSKANHTDHCMPLFKRNRVLIVGDQVMLENAKLMYKLESDLCPTPIKNMYTRSSHGYGTRWSSIRINRHKLSMVNRSFLCKPIMEWQTIPVDIKLSSNLTLFTQKMKRYFLEKY